MSSGSAVSIVGLGKLGSPMVACLASKGVTVVGVDSDEAKVRAIAEAQAPVYEPDLAELLDRGRAHITATTDTAEAVRQTDITMVVVPTPSEEDGGFSLRFALPACAAIGAAIAQKDTYHLVVITSTVMPGATGGALRAALEESSGKRAGEDFGLCYSPEFIALGSVIRDFLNPDFLLVGESDPRAGDLLVELYENVVDNDPPVARLSFVNAELAKIAVNTFITTKIAFANMLAWICESLPEGDVDQVTSALGLDTRIGAKYLYGAISYGGPCFPRDNLALASLARALDAPAFVAEATDVSNRDGIDRLCRLVTSHLSSGGTVGVLGLAYKPGTDVVDESPGVHLIRSLNAQGVPVVAFDPAAVESARRVLDGAETVTFADNALDCVRAADVIVIATPWPEFSAIPPAELARDGEPRVVVDCWRVLNAADVSPLATYVALGHGRRERVGVTR